MQKNLLVILVSYWESISNSRSNDIISTAKILKRSLHKWNGKIYIPYTKNYLLTGFFHVFTNGKRSEYVFSFKNYDCHLNFIKIALVQSSATGTGFISTVFLSQDASCVKAIDTTAKCSRDFFNCQRATSSRIQSFCLLCSRVPTYTPHWLQVS